MPFIPLIAPRVTMFFVDGITGWSESHYDCTAQTLTAAIQNAATILVPARCQLLATGPWLQYVRASYDNVYRDSQVAYLEPPGMLNGRVTNNPAWFQNPANIDFVTALLRGVGGDLYRKQIYVSGVPVPDETDVLQPVNDPNYLNAFINYERILTGALGTVTPVYGFPIWQRDQITFPLHPITAVLNVAPWTVTCPGHGLIPGAPPPAGTRVWIFGARYLPMLPKQKINGPWLVQNVIDANNLQLLNFAILPGTTVANASLQVQMKNIITYKSLILENFTHRKRGRPFDSPRGRSRTRVRNVAY
jgi:hypothetical protein